jgi:penicillin amidase
MNREQNQNLKKLISSGAISIVLVFAFSIPLGIIPPLGNFLLPGEGIWSVPAEVPESETLTIKALSDDVTVYRDQWGIPHIYGTNDSDLLYALGYCQAQDRLFQMEMARRLTSGRLSEVLGPGDDNYYIWADQFNLNMMKLYWANETYEELKSSSDPDDQDILAQMLSFIEGVNYYLQTHQNQLPIEYQILNFKPQPWTPIDILIIEKYMAEMLTWSYDDFYNLAIVNAIGKENYTELYGLPMPYQIPVCPDYGNYDDISQPGSVLDASETIPSILPENAGLSEDSSDLAYIGNVVKEFMEGITNIPGEIERITNQKAIGSNNWAVNGSKTLSGMPILCNDMHLDFNLPGIWYEAHLVNQDPSHLNNVYAFFIAGVPEPIVGHNDYISWGCTNVAFDVIDWYYYNGYNSTHYWYKGAKTPYSTVSYTINVKGEAPVPYTVKSTVHGPVFTDLLKTEFTNLYPDQVIACKWLAQNVTHTFKALYGFMHAKNRAEFDAASEDFDCPAQNLIYADINGNIGIRPTGDVPIRDDSGIPAWHLGNGTMPYNGTEGQGEWISYISFDDLPHSENPDQGYLASANQISAGPEYLNQYSLQNPLGVDPGFRARRLNNLLALHDDITIEDMKAFQLDCYSEWAGNLTSYLTNVITSIGSKTEIQQDALDILTAWNFLMDHEEVAPTLFNVWLEIMMDETFADEFADTVIQGGYTSDAILEKLIRTDPNSDWFDNVSTGAIEDRDDIILTAFNRALDELTIYFPGLDISTWKWGELNKAYFPHIVGLEALSSKLYPTNGTENTVSPFWGSVWQNGEIRMITSVGGASERMIIDFSDMNKSLSIIPSGQRGVPTSKHYKDQLEMYMNGQYHVQYFSATTPTAFLEAWRESEINFIKGA